MKPVLWQTLAGTAGSHSRLQILYLLSERLQNANRLAKELSLNYLLTDQINEHWGTVEKINEAVNWE